MLSLIARNPLYFPRLKRPKEKPQGGLPENTRLFYLDWDGQSEMVKRSRQRAAERVPEASPEFSWRIPERVRLQVDHYLFALTPGYVRGVERMSKYALEIWNEYWNFGPNIREMCLQPAVEAVWCAFMLLEDCLYDPESGFFNRDVAKAEIALASMVLRFWDHQTGGRLLWDHAKMDRLLMMEAHCPDDEDKRQITDFVNMMKAELHC